MLYFNTFYKLGIIFKFLFYNCSQTAQIDYVFKSEIVWSLQLLYIYLCVNEKEKISRYLCAFVANFLDCYVFHMII